jgi:hypothetical protein
LEIQPEELPVSQIINTGDEIWDQRVVAHINDDLMAGNLYAWFRAAVTAEWRQMEATEFLGGVPTVTNRNLEIPPFFKTLKSRRITSLLPN